MQSELTDSELIEAVATKRKKWDRAYYQRHKAKILAQQAEYSRTKAGRGAEYRKARAYAARHPEKRWAHEKVKDALRRGDLMKSPCEECGSLNVQAHHDDYTKPLSVRWLCRRHHRAFHSDLIHAA